MQFMMMPQVYFLMCNINITKREQNHHHYCCGQLHHSREQFTAAPARLPCSLSYRCQRLTFRCSA